MEAQTMREDIFRKKSIKKIQSPESLNDYIQVSNPSVWLIIIAVIALLVGACIWGILGRIESKVDISATVSDGYAICYVDAQDANEIDPGQKVLFDSNEGSVLSISDFQIDGTYEVLIRTSLPDGTYDGSIVTESVAPFSFIFN